MTIAQIFKIFILFHDRWSMHCINCYCNKRLRWFEFSCAHKNSVAFGVISNMARYLIINWHRVYYAWLRAKTRITWKYSLWILPTHVGFNFVKWLCNAIEGFYLQTMSIDLHVRSNNLYIRNVCNMVHILIKQRQ